MIENNELGFMHCDFSLLSNEKLIDYLYELGDYQNCLLSFEMENFYIRVNLAKEELLKRLNYTQ